MSSIFKRGGTVFPKPCAKERHQKQERRTIPSIAPKMLAPTGSHDAIDFFFFYLPKIRMLGDKMGRLCLQMFMCLCFNLFLFFYYFCKLQV